jgi:hypothetical protein
MVPNDMDDAVEVTDYEEQGQQVDDAYDGHP